MSNALKVVSIAKAEDGYKEKASNSNLDSPSANAGSANYTKYARDLAAAGYYNGSKQGFEWCDVFVDWVFWMAYGKNAAKAQAAQCQTGPLGAACPYSADYFKAKGRFDKNPQIGDQIFFQQNGRIVHTGVVVGVSDTTVTTEEGNSGNCVKSHTYSRNDSYIAGYGHPIFDDSSSGGNTPAPAPTPAVDFTAKVKEWQQFLGVAQDGDPGPDTKIAALKKMLLALLTKHPLSQGASGDEVKVLQGLLYAAKYDANGLDGSYGPGCAAAVKVFEKDTGQAQDGQAGKNVVAALLDKVFN